MKKAVTVCVMTSVHPPTDSRIYEKEIKSLLKAGYRVVFINPQKEGGEGNLVYRKAEMPAFRLFRLLAGPRAVYRAAMACQADIFHFHDPELLKIGLRLMKRGKVIYDVHEDVPRQILSKEWIPKILRGAVSRWFERREKRLACRLSYVVTATDFIADIFRSCDCAHVAAVHNYPKLSEFAVPPMETRENAVCYVGGITRVRGIVEMVRALEYMDVKLKLAGTFDSPALEREVKAMPGWAKVEYAGQVDRADAAAIMSSSKAGLVTLHPIVNYLDALPIKMFEYMAARIPVIASDFSLWRGILDEGRCGVTVDPLDPKSIAGAIKRLLSDPAAEEMGENGRRLVLEKYNWAQEEQVLLAVYEELAV